MKPSLVIVGLLLSGTAHAQLSLRAGANASTLTTGQEEYRRGSAKGGVGYQLGLAYEKKIANRWSLLPELSYRLQGLDLKVEDNSISDGSYAANYRLALHYLTLPVMARGTFGKFYAEAGPYGSFLLAAHEKGLEYRGTIAGTYEVSFDRPATDRYQRFDVGLGAGVGVQLPAGVALGLRATTGLLSLTNENQLYVYRGTLKNQVLEVSLSYSFGTE
ncbi:MAG TPA: porin family protein [Hymenobacter sp.]|jgi:hypothetical protein